MDDKLTFVDNNKDRMRYVALREAGLPADGAAVESSCKTVIGFRTKKGGRQWYEKGVSAILTFRVFEQSEQLPGFWGQLVKTYSARVEHVAA